MKGRMMVWVLAVSLAPAAVHAQSTEVKKYLNSAVALFENLEYEKALKQLQRAKTLSTGSADDASIALYEGVVFADMGKEEKALASFEMGLSLTPEAKLPLAVSPKVEKVFATARQHVAKVLAPQLEAQREEERLKAEARKSEAEKQKKEEDDRKKAEDERRDEEERRAARQAPANPVVVEKVSSGPSVRLLAVIPLAVGVASAVAATFFLLDAKSRADSLDQHTVLPGEAINARDSGKSMATLGYVFSGVAAAGVATAGLMFALGRSSSSAPSIAVSAGPGSAWVAVGGSFP